MDGSEIECESLQKLINDESDLETCGQAFDTTESLKGIQSTNPHIVIINLSVKDEKHFDLIHSLKRIDIQIPILAVALHDESSFSERVFQAGGRGYLMKQDAAQNVIAAIRTVLSGKVYLSDQMKAKLPESYRKKLDDSGLKQ